MDYKDLASVMEDHALESVPAAERKSWMQLSWNTAGLVTTLVILFFGALVCFVAGTRIALLAGLASFTVGTGIGWAIARVAYSTGYSNTLITRKFGLGTRGSALASLIFGFLIIGFLALENGLLYRGFVFFLGIHDSWGSRILIYGGLTVTWILLTAFGFMLVTRFSSLTLLAFLVVLGVIIVDILNQSGRPLAEAFLFPTQVPSEMLAQMGIESEWDKFIFSLNILLGPSCALALNTADFGRYGKSAAHVGAAATIGILFQSLIIMIIGGVLMYAGAPAMTEYYTSVAGMGADEARQSVLRSPDSIAATFMVFAGTLGFLLMLLAQAKAQVLNTYSSSLCLANLFDAAVKWRPGRVFFVVLANIIALVMLYGHILELVEAWIRLLGVLLSSLAGVIIMDYYFTSRRLPRPVGEKIVEDKVNWAGVITIIASVVLAHGLLKPYQPIEVFTSLACVFLLYPLLRLVILRPRNL